MFKINVWNILSYPPDLLYTSSKANVSFSDIPKLRQTACAGVTLTLYVTKTTIH